MLLTYMPSKPCERTNPKSKMLMLHLPVEDTKMSISDMTPGHVQGTPNKTQKGSPFCRPEAGTIK